MYKSLTIMEHKEMGRKIRSLHTQLLDFAMATAGRFGASSPEYLRIKNCAKPLDELRNLLDNKYFDSGGEIPSPYYSSRAKERA